MSLVPTQLRRRRVDRGADASVSLRSSLLVRLRLPPWPGGPNVRGWWNMACWNGLSEYQQHRLLTYGNLPIDYRPEVGCPNGAEVAIETQNDVAPGPRFYCRACAVEYLADDLPAEFRPYFSDEPLPESVIRRAKDG